MSDLTKGARLRELCQEAVELRHRLYYGIDYAQYPELSEDANTLGGVLAKMEMLLRDEPQGGALTAIQAVLDHDYPYIGLSCFTPDQDAAGIMAAASVRKAIKDDLRRALTDGEAPPDHQRPSVDELLGIDPAWTGDLSVDEYIAQQRRES